MCLFVAHTAQIITALCASFDVISLCIIYCRYITLYYKFSLLVALNLQKGCAVCPADLIECTCSMSAYVLYSFAHCRVMCAHLVIMCRVDVYS